MPDPKGHIVRHVEFWHERGGHAVSMGGWLEFFNDLTQTWEKVPTFLGYGHIDTAGDKATPVVDKYEEKNG